MNSKRKKELDEAIYNSSNPGYIPVANDDERAYVQGKLLDKADKFDNGKLQWELLPWEGLEEVVKVAEMGANKYGKYNYRKGMEWTKVINSAFRHLVSIRNGVDFDSESKLLHAAHLVFNGLMLIEYYYNHKELDNRPDKQKIKENIAGDDKGFEKRFQIQNTFEPYTGEILD